MTFSYLLRFIYTNLSTECQLVPLLALTHGLTLEHCMGVFFCTLDSYRSPHTAKPQRPWRVRDPVPFVPTGLISRTRRRIWQDAPPSSCSSFFRRDGKGATLSSRIQCSSFDARRSRCQKPPSTTLEASRAAFPYGSAVAERWREYLGRKKYKFTPSSLPNGERESSIVVR